MGIKLFGIYCFVLALPHIVNLISTFLYTPTDMPEDYQKAMRLIKIFIWIIPIIFVALGFYFLRDGRLVYKIAYPNDISESNSDFSSKLIMFLKFLGIFLIITNFPNMLKVISNYFAYSNAPGVYGMDAQRQFVYLNVIPSTVSILLGFYLLISGKLFIKLGLKE